MDIYIYIYMYIYIHTFIYMYRAWSSQAGFENLRTRTSLNHHSIPKLLYHNVALNTARYTLYIRRKRYIHLRSPMYP